MIFARFMAIVFLVIALAILVVSNPLPALNLMFLGGRTVAISLGLLCLGALGSGLAAALTIRTLLLSYVASRVKTLKAKNKDLPSPEFAYQPPLEEAPAYEEEYPRDRLDNYADSADARSERNRPRPNLTDEREPIDNVVRDANYRVISPPKNTPPTPKPQVDSTLKPDSEDWGFDFDEEE
jgi:hypothetical protein